MLFTDPIPAIRVFLEIDRIVIDGNWLFALSLARTLDVWCTSTRLGRVSRGNSKPQQGMLDNSVNDVRFHLV